MQFRPQERPLVVTVCQLRVRVSSSGHRTNVCWSSLSSELSQQWLHIEHGHTNGLKTALTDLKGQDWPSCCSECHFSYRMSTVLSSSIAFRVTSDPRHNNVYLLVLYIPLSALSCCKWQVTLDRMWMFTLPVLCDHLLMECKSVLQGRCSGHLSELKAVLQKVTLILVLS